METIYNTLPFDTSLFHEIPNKLCANPNCLNIPKILIYPPDTVVIYCKYCSFHGKYHIKNYLSIIDCQLDFNKIQQNLMINIINLYNNSLL